MRLHYWITRSIGAPAAIAAVAFITVNASADGYQRSGIVPVAGCANFRGFYVGGNIGWATLTAHQNDLDGAVTGLPGPGGFTGVPSGFTATDDTFTAGAQVGYNIQKGCTLFGIEADWNWADLNADTRLFPRLGGLVD